MTNATTDEGSPVRLAHRSITPMQALRVAFLRDLPSTLEPEHHRQILMEQFGVASRQVLVLHGVAAIAGAMLCVVFIGSEIELWLFGWYLLYMAVTLITVAAMRAMLTYSPLRSASIKRLHFLERISRFQAALLGVLWSLCALATNFDPTTLQLMLCGAVLAGVICVGAMGLATAPSISMSFAVAAMTPIGFLVRDTTNTESLILIGCIPLGVFVLSVVVARSYVTFLESQLLRLEIERNGEVIGVLLKDFEANTSDWLWETDRSARLSYAPERMRTMLASKGKGLIGSKLYGLIAADNQEEWSELRNAMRARRPFREIEVPVDTVTGLRWWSLTGAPRTNRKGDFLGFRGVGADITIRRRTEEKMREARRAAELALEAKSRFVASMSHELRTPLNAVVGYAELLSDADSNGAMHPRVPEFAQEIETAGRHLIDVVNDVLDIAVIDSAAALSPREVSLRELAKAAIAMLQGKAEAEGVALRLVRSRDFLVLIDERRMRQALINLMTNAIRHTPAGGEIIIALERRASGETMISVSDNGEGMAEEVAERLFEPFVHGGAPGDYNTDRRLGLGLAIVRAVARAHGGDAAALADREVGASLLISIPAFRMVTRDGRRTLRDSARAG